MVGFDLVWEFSQIGESIMKESTSVFTNMEKLTNLWAELESTYNFISVHTNPEIWGYFFSKSKLMKTATCKKCYRNGDFA